MQLIGLSGYARSGKDEAAKVLVEEFGFKRLAFADKLREFLYALDPMVDMFRKYSSTEPDGPPIRLQEVIDTYGWDGYKESHFGTEIRGLLQRLGTEAGRNTLWDSIWIDATLHDLSPEGKYVVTDARFPNEAAAIEERGGVLARITRDGVGPANEHPSETSLDDYDFKWRISNYGTLDEFHSHVANFYKKGFGLI